MEMIDFLKLNGRGAPEGVETLAPFSMQTSPVERIALNRSKSEALTAAAPA